MWIYLFIRGRAPCRKHDGWALPVTRRVKNKQKVSHSAQKQVRVLAGDNPFKWSEASKRAVLPNLIPRKPVGQQRMLARLQRGRDATSAPWGGHDAACRRGPSCSLQYHGPSTCRNFRRSRSFRRGTRRGGAYAPPRLLPSQACSTATKHRLIEGPPYGDEQDRRREQEHPWPPH